MNYVLFVLIVTTLEPWNNIKYIEFPYENTTHCQMSRFLNQQGYWINPSSYIL